MSTGIPGPQGPSGGFPAGCRPLAAHRIHRPVDAPAVAAKMLEKGILVNTIGEHILRLVPPLIIEKEEINFFMNTLEEILKGM